MTVTDLTSVRAPDVKRSSSPCSGMTTTKATRFIPAPALSDAAGWSCLFATGMIRKIRNSEVLLAYDHWVHRNRGLAESLRKRLAEEVARLLRWRIGRQLKNEGKDIIVDAATVIGRAIDDPWSRRGISMRKNFWYFVFWRTLDAIERAERQNKPNNLEFVEYDEDKTTDESPDQVATAMQHRLDVYRLIRSLAPPKDLAAFLRVKGHSYADIAKFTKVASHNTVRAWLSPYKRILG